MKRHYKIIIISFLIVLGLFGVYLLNNRSEFNDGKKRLICVSLEPPMWDFDETLLNYKNYKIIEFDNNDEVVSVINRIVVDYHKKDSYLTMTSLYNENPDSFYLNFNINSNVIKVEERELKVKFNSKKYIITIDNMITKKEKNEMFLRLETKNYTKYEEIKKVLKSSHKC